MIHWFSLPLSMSFSPHQHFHRCQKPPPHLRVSNQKPTFVLIIVHSKPWEHNRCVYSSCHHLSRGTGWTPGRSSYQRTLFTLSNTWGQAVGAWLERKQSCLNCLHFSWMSMPPLRFHHVQRAVDPPHGQTYPTEGPICRCTFIQLCVSVWRASWYKSLGLCEL